MNSKESVNGVSSEKEMDVEKPLFAEEMKSHAVGDSSAHQLHDESTDHIEEIPELDEVKPVDFSGFGKPEFVDFIKALSVEHDFKKIDAQLREHARIVGHGRERAIGVAADAVQARTDRNVGLVRVGKTQSEGVHREEI